MKKINVVLILLMVLIIGFSIYVYGNDSNFLGENHITNLGEPIILKGVPDVRQPTDYSCGPTCLQAVLNYYGQDVRVDKLINITNCTPENGTTPQNLANGAGSYGLKAEVKENLTLNDLENYLKQGIPVIVACQAWAENNTVWTEDQEDGHYMVVIGIDQENVYFEDPSILGSRGFIPHQEFLDRWHDIVVGMPGKSYDHLGIIINSTPKSSPAFIHIE